VIGHHPEFLFVKVCSGHSEKDCKGELEEFLFGTFLRAGFTVSNTVFTKPQAVTATDGKCNISLNLIRTSRKRFGKTIHVIARNTETKEVQSAREIPWVVALVDDLPRDVLIVSQTRSDLRKGGSVFGCRELLLFYFLCEQRGWFSEVMDVDDDDASLEVFRFLAFAAEHMNSSRPIEITISGASKFVRSAIREIEVSAGKGAIERKFGLRNLGFFEKFREFVRGARPRG
jgi:hypothetical protein